MSLSNYQYPNPICGVRNRIPVSVQADAAWDTYDDYYVELQILQEDGYRSGTFTDWVALPHRAPDSTGKIEWQINELLEDMLSPEPPPANLLDRNPQRLEQSVRRYRIALPEYINGVLSGQPSTFTGWLVRAGFNNYRDQHLYAWAITDNQSLTHQPEWKDTTLYLPEYHTVVLPSNMTARLNYKVYYEDGTTQEVATTKTFAGLQYDVVRFPAGYEQIGLDQLPKQAVEWEAWISNDADQSEVGGRTSYRLDPWDYSPLPRYFLWEGSLGGWHSLRSKGENIREASVISSNVERLIPTGSLQQVRQQYGTRYEQTHEQYSGYLPDGHAAWLLDLMLSEDVYLTQDFGYQRERKVIDRESFTVERDNDFLQRVSFAYRDATGAHRGL